MKYYSAIENTEVLMYVTIRTNLKSIMLSEKV